ncbi:hypothetical protein F3J27_20585 [Enterobacter sp. Ap-916]|uniref:hypothetical protein n=1 Tax=unclassified Enterobacter TaxID=2608935 RepID=UPI00141F01D9|nr:MULTISPECIES: hypothetical protein [unclassified Enterobacter]NIF60719.1 hypothetical protein [Enterobacter sp. Ap-867]NIG31873.1 hypothetical protein [Enterobacter sp. Ap-916]
MKAGVLLAMLFVTSMSWAAEPGPKEQAREMAEAACQAQYQLLHTRFELGRSETEAVAASNKILDAYLRKNKESLGEHVAALMGNNLLSQLHELEANPETVTHLKSPPAGFKEKFLSFCISDKTEKIESLHVFG